MTSGSPPRLLTRDQRRRLLVAVVLCALAFALLTAVAEEQYLFTPEQQIRDLIQWERHPFLEPPMKALTRVGSGWVLLGLACVLWVTYRERLGGLLLELGGMAAAAALISGLAKWLTARPRPGLRPYGFPSGHTLAAVVFFGALIYLVWVFAMSPRRWRVFTTGGALMVAGIAYSRIYVDAHWLTDVLGGLTAGSTLAGAGTLLIDRKLRNRQGISSAMPNARHAGP